jgi:peptide/nickel transport system permease protein
MKKVETKSKSCQKGLARFALLRQRKALSAGLSLVSVFYLIALFADFLAPYDYRAQSRREPLAPPAALHFCGAQLCLYAQRLIDPLERRYVMDTQQSYPLTFFTPGYSYRLVGVIAMNLHLFGVRNKDVNAPQVHLLGTDALGRDRLARLLIAARFSLVVGPAALVLASLLGVLIGCLAGYAVRWVDAMLMRAADVMLALPTLLLALAARAAFPPELPPRRAAFLLIGIFVALGWAEMARLTRGLVLELRRREFVAGALSLGATPWRILFRHILPNVARPLSVQALLLLPAFLLTETSLSFLGVGVQEPEASWGSLLASAADIALLQRGDVLALLTPAFAIVVFVGGVRLLSQGLQQADEEQNH